MDTYILPLAAYCFVMSSTPGPNNVMLAASGANFGFRDTLPHILGIVVGGAVQTFAACVGLGALLAEWPAWQVLLRWVGAAYLLVLAWRLVGSGIADGGLARPLTLAQGALFQAVNPKSWMKALTLAAVFMPPGWPVLHGSLLVAGVGLAVGLPCVSVWALFGAAIRRWLQQEGHRRAFNAIMAGLLAVLAFAFLQ